jgi:hypothetical protein
VAKRVPGQGDVSKELAGRILAGLISGDLHSRDRMDREVGSDVFSRWTVEQLLDAQNLAMLIASAICEGSDNHWIRLRAANRIASNARVGTMAKRALVVQYISDAQKEFALASTAHKVWICNRCACVTPLRLELAPLTCPEILQDGTTCNGDGHEEYQRPRRTDDRTGSGEHRRSLVVFGLSDDETDPDTDSSYLSAEPETDDETPEFEQRSVSEYLVTLLTSVETEFSKLKPDVVSQVLLRSMSAEWTAAELCKRANVLVGRSKDSKSLRKTFHEASHQPIRKSKQSKRDVTASATAAELKDDIDF